MHRMSAPQSFLKWTLFSQRELGNCFFHKVLDPFVRKVIYTDTLVHFKTASLAFHHYIIPQLLEVEHLQSGLLMYKKLLV